MWMPKNMEKSINNKIMRLTYKSEWITSYIKVKEDDGNWLLIDVCFQFLYYITHLFFIIVVSFHLGQRKTINISEI